MPTATLDQAFRTSTEIFDDCLDAGVKYRDLRDTPENRRSDDYDADLAKARRDLLNLNDDLEIAQRMERIAIEAAAWEHAVANPPSEARGPQAAMLPTGDERRSAGEMVTGSEQYAARSPKGFDQVEVRNLLTGTSLGTSGSNLFVPQGTPFLQVGSIERRRAFLRDLLSVNQTTLGSVPYIRELNAGSLEGGASAVQEASAKPEVTMTFERDDAPVRKIAAWIQATDEALDDAPLLRGYIDTRLAYMLMIREEAEVLDGGGTAPHIKGILDYNIQSQGSTPLYEGVGISIGKIEARDGYADGVVVHPTDFWAAVTDRHSEQFDGQSTNGNAPFGGAARTIWDLPVVRSRGVAAGTALVGAFQLGATLVEREGVTIRSTDSHASLFISNTVVILAEERVGLLMHNENWFCSLTVAAPS